MNKMLIVAALAVLGACGEMPSEETAAASGPPVEVTADELFRAYEANEVAAQQQFGGKQLLVSGTIGSITLDFMDDPVIQLETSNMFSSAQASLTEEHKPKAAELSKGQGIMLLCKGVSEVIGSPMLSDCEIQ